MAKLEKNQLDNLRIICGGKLSGVFCKAKEGHTYICP